VIIAPDPARVIAANRRYARVAAGAGAVFLLVLAGLWIVREPDPVTPAAPPPDPYAGRRAEAAPTVAPAVDSDRAFLDAPAEAAVAYQAGDLPSALKHYQDAVERNPQDAESLSNLGQVLVKLNRVGEALPYFDRAIALIPDRWAYTFNRARALGLLGRWPEAVTEYRRAQALFPDDYVTTFNLALALRRLGDHEAAVAEFQKAIELEPTDASFRMALGSTYERLRKPAEAAAAYEEALRLAPEAPDADIVRGRIKQLRGAAGGT
jgi:Flp pilus assembly protein TadD